MKHKSTIQHEVADFRQSRRLAEVCGLGSDDAQRPVFSAAALHLPPYAENFIQKTDAFQILLQACKTFWSILAAEFTCVSRLDDTQAILRQPYFMFRTPCLAEARWKRGLSQFRRHDQRFQNGNAEAVSRPADSNTRSCAIQFSRVIGRWFLRYSATRCRSSARFSSMLASPADMF